MDANGTAKFGGLRSQMSRAGNNNNNKTEPLYYIPNNRAGRNNGDESPYWEVSYDPRRSQNARPPNSVRSTPTHPSHASSVIYNRPSPHSQTYSQQNYARTKNNFLLNNDELMHLRKVRNKISRDSEVCVKEMKAKIQQPKGWSGKRLLLGFGCLFAGLVGFASYEPMVDYSLDAILQIKPGGIFTWAWSYNPIPLLGEFYLLEILNGNEWLEGAKPQIRKLGPFSYLMYRKRKVLGYTEDMVEFLESYEMYQNPDAGLPMDTPVTMINFPIFGSLAVGETLLKQFYLSFLKPVVFNVMVAALRASGEELIETRLASEVFAGRKINLLDILETYGLQPLRKMGIAVPEVGIGVFKLRNATFGFKTLLAGVDFGPYQAWRATKDGHIAGHFTTYRGERTSPNYRAPCNRIGGSDGILFGRNLKAERVSVYNHLVCRQLSLVNKGVEYYNGVRTIRYENDVQMFNMSKSQYSCYCFEGDTEYCQGWTDASGCFEGIKVAISFPNFYNNPLRQRALRGLEFHNREMSTSYLNVEPNLGLPLNAVIALQGAFVLKDLGAVSSLSSIKDVWFPIFIAKLSLGANAWQSVAALIGTKALAYGSYGFLFAGLGAGGYQFYRGIKKNN